MNTGLLPIGKELERETFEEMMEGYSQEALVLMVSRHKKYGAGNIGRHGLLGVTVRLHDKIERLNNMVIDGNGGDSADESIRDTLLDIANYGLIGLACLDGKWTRNYCPPLGSATVGS